MKKHGIAALALAAAIFTTATGAGAAESQKEKSADKSTGKISFVVMGDSRPVGPLIPQSPPFKQMLWETDLIHPNANIHVGDLVFGYGSSGKELKRQYDDLVATLKLAKTPIHFAKGNHEIGSSGGQDQYTGKVGKLYYSFDIGKNHFIILDSDWGDKGDSGTLGQEQFDWLKRDLLAARIFDNVFVFMHKPMFDSKKGDGSSWDDIKMRDEVHKMFVKAGNVRIVFAGHIHDYRYIERDGIPYYVTGGAGAETHNPENGGFYHYLYVQVRGKKADVRVIEPYHLWQYCEPECNGKNDTVKVNIVNSLGSNMPIMLKGVEVTMPALPAGKHYQPNGSRILETTNNPDGTVTLRMRALMNSPIGYKFFYLAPADDK